MACSGRAAEADGYAVRQKRRIKMEWKQYKRKGLSEMRPYVLGEDLSTISVSKEDDPPNDMGMIARNPKNHFDQWYVAREYFEDNLELAQPKDSADLPGCSCPSEWSFECTFFKDGKCSYIR